MKVKSPMLYVMLLWSKVAAELWLSGKKIVDRPESDKLIRASVANKSELEIYLYFPQIYKHVKNFSS